ncbi:MAG: hypothetical protein ACLFUN_02125 [Desulfobacterales bacterium]
MGRREKILVALMIAAVLYGAFELFLPARQTDQNQNKDTDIESARQIAEKISAEMEQAKLNPEQTHVLQLAAQNWGRDPFYRLPEQTMPEKPESSESKGAEGLRYTGYLKVGDIKMAIINGAEYRTGERIDNGGRVVREIYAKKVVLQSPDTGERIIVQYKE